MICVYKYNINVSRYADISDILFCVYAHMCKYSNRLRSNAVCWTYARLMMQGILKPASLHCKAVGIARRAQLPAIPYSPNIQFWCKPCPRCSPKCSNHLKEEHCPYPYQLVDVVTAVSPEAVSETCQKECNRSALRKCCDTVCLACQPVVFVCLHVGAWTVGKNNTVFKGMQA